MCDLTLSPLSLEDVMHVIVFYGGEFRVLESGPILASEALMAQAEFQKHRSPVEFFSLDAFLDWLAPIVVVIVIGGMLFALIGAVLAPVD